MEAQRTPKVSVIVPNYNHALYLTQRIDSILSQSFKNFELIILDDCSTDNSRDIIERYRNDEHVTYIKYNTINSRNTFKQWDKGIELAKGELIWIAESDDVAHPEFLSSLVEQMDKYPKATVAFSHSTLIDQNGNDMHINWHLDNNPDSVYVHNGTKFAHKVMTKSNSIYNASMVLFRQSIYSLIDKSFQQYKSCGDWAFWMSACLQGDVIEVCRRLNYFRQHSNKVTVNAGKAGTAWMSVGSLLHEFITLLNLKGWELHKFRGHWTMDLRNSSFPNKDELIQNFPDVFNGNTFDIICYKLSRAYEKLTQIGYPKNNLTTNERTTN